MKSSRAQIVATIGPTSSNYETLKPMALHSMDVVRLNFSWESKDDHLRYIGLVRQIEKELGRKIPIIADLPGHRIQNGEEHTYDKKAAPGLTDKDKDFIKFCIEQGVDYLALSFVGEAEDIEVCREFVKELSGTQKIIAKIEREKAVLHLDEIIDKSDAIMIARGDLGNEIPFEKIPFIQADITKRCKTAGKPVIVATEMFLSMTESQRPTRAEVSDVEGAILQGADAVMLSEETARGKHPVQAVEMMEKAVFEAEKHMESKHTVNKL